MFLQRGSGAKGQEVRLHCSLGSARPTAAIPLSARRLDAALKGQLYPECGDAGCCCFTVPLYLIALSWQAHRKLGTFAKPMEENPGFMFGLGTLRRYNLSPQFSNQFVIRGCLKSVWFLHRVLTMTHSHNPLKMEFFPFHGQMNSLLRRKVPLKVYLQCHQTLGCFIYIAKKKTEKNKNKNLLPFQKKRKI